ncbi:alpha/beta hydrolase [Mesobacterium sp. TK19101]|uniref:Alpha/beta hydrolase n=1 Tax=Mesobacterium hydrothermale TaxID=3111907 RepID=A0ABU6HBU9_9RHOB|nr:alpha/beta hydrolase [Mesobacterium sp. TK19101]MEC3859938.1 alpha/beta hydrolase [Mesobacterium sp. TK19101]
MCDTRAFAVQSGAIGLSRPVMFMPLSEGERLEGMASEILVHAPAKFALVGHDLGGMVAIEVMRRAPERVTRLALIASSAQAETPKDAAARDPQMIRVKAGRLDAVMRDEVIPPQIAQGPHRLAVAGLMADMARALGPQVFQRQSRALQRRQDQQSTLRRIHVPTLILCGARDSLTPVKRQQFLAEMIPGAALTVLDEAGHVPMLEKPQETTAALDAWLGAPLVLG